MRVPLTVAVTVAMLGATPAALAMPGPPRHPALKRYVAKVAPQIGIYRALAGRAGDLLSEQPRINVDPFVEELRRISTGFDRLRIRWRKIAAPRGLKVRHRGMGKAFMLLARALRTWADAVFTRQVDEMARALDRVTEMTRSAAYLQRRWAAALRGALRRARLRVPVWVRELALPTMS